MTQLSVGRWIQYPIKTNAGAAGQALWPRPNFNFSSALLWRAVLCRRGYREDRRVQRRRTVEVKHVFERMCVGITQS